MVEDDFPLRLALTALLRVAGYAVQAVGSAEEAEAAAKEQEPALVLLDWNLPGQSGLELLRRWSHAARGLPVILLTARDAVADRVQGLDAGAVDYVVKPFANEELLARVRVQLRHASAEKVEEIVLSCCAVDLRRGLVTRGDETLTLTTKESELLKYLVERGGQAVSRRELLREVWGYRGGLHTRTVDNTVARLRGKLERDPGRPMHVITVHGEGYRFVGG